MTTITHPAAALTAGVYKAGLDGRRFVVEVTGQDSAVLRAVRADGTPSSSIHARIVAGQLDRVTGNGRPFAARIATIAADPASHRVQAHCNYPGCGRVLTDPESVASGFGPEHRPTDPGPAAETAEREAATSALTSADVRDLPISAIRRNPDQPRQVFDPAALAELAASIKSFGLLQPLTVRPAGDGGGYILIAGERRWRACQLAGLTFASSRIVDTDEASAYPLSVIENINREDMNILEEAGAYQKLVNGYGWSAAEIAAKTGKTKVHVEWRLGLLTLCDEIRGHVISGAIKPNLAWHIARLTPANQRHAAGRYLRGEFASEFEAANLAQALAATEQQPSMFALQAEELDEERKAERATRRRQAKSRFDRLAAALPLIDEIAKARPEELADLFSGEIGRDLDVIEGLAAAAVKARSQMRKAKAHTEARRIALNPEAVVA